MNLPKMLESPRATLADALGDVDLEPALGDVDLEPGIRSELGDNPLQVYK